MAYKKHVELQTDNAIQLGGKDKSGKANPTSIEGYYLGYKTTPDQGYGPGTLHIFQTETGTVGVWGKTNLNRILTAERRGQMVLVEFTGMGQAKKGRRPAYNYELQYDEENTMDVSGIELNVSSDDSNENYEEDVAEETETSLDAEESQPDEVVPTKAAAPKKPLTTPSASAQKRVQDLLARRTGV